MDCGFSERDILLYYYGEMDEAERKRLQRHLHGCERCGSRLSELREALDRLPAELQVPGVNLDDFRVRVREKLERRQKRRGVLPLNLSPVQAVVALLFVIVTAIGGMKLYHDRQEQRFIMENYELIVNMELLEDIEIIEHLEEFSEV
jgi:anti-sigma factor RsiW